MLTDIADSGGSDMPDAAVRSGDMTTRGARIKRERNRRKLSQMDLHKATDVGLRTIGRVEAGEAENSPSIEVLEAHLGISDESVGTEPRTAEEPAADPSLSKVMELLAEAMRIVAQIESRSGSRAVHEPRQVRWPASAMPSAQRKQGPDHPEHSREVQ